MSSPQEHPLKEPVTRLFGVGNERAAQLACLGIHTIEDLLLHKPNRYEDRRNFSSFRDLRIGASALVRGRIIAHGVKTFKKTKKSIYEFILDDGTALLYCRWWQMPFLEKYFQKDDDVVVYGVLKEVNPRVMYHPDTEVLETGDEVSAHFDRITPVYPLTEGVQQRWLRGLIWRTLAKYEELIPEAHPEIFPDGLPSRSNAVHMMHFPEELQDADLAERRLAYDEFLELQLQIQTRRRKLQSNAVGLPCSGTNQLIKPFLTRLNFKLTEAQTKVLKEIRKDLGGPYPMRRLLQGDVGSGKTVVAACSALMAIESGFSVALMAPTTLLAEQHFRGFSSWLETLDVPVQLLTSDSVNKTATKPQETNISTKPTVFIGTHALIQQDVALPKLGLVIMDEQHKFGVAQREALVKKGRYPHVLVMTATPIPRTLGLTLYGDLDVSTIDQLPAGRGAIKTYVRTQEQLPKVWEFIRKKLEQGRQAYVVYPRLEEGDSENGIKAVLDESEKLSQVFAPWKVAVIHGRLPSDQRDTVMSAFRQNEVHVLLATSVIEVGVDVPNATTMLVENAERFGLAQLHQLRGRIGRGEHESYCILMAAIQNEEAIARLRVMAETTDGFRIAEADLSMRGPGELCGQEQSGLPRLRFGDLRKDYDLIALAREKARELLNRDSQK